MSSEDLEADLGDEGMQCHDCDEKHLDWTKVGSYTVDDGYHRGIIEQLECGRCGAITEGGRP